MNTNQIINSQNRTGEKMRAIVEATAVFCVTAETLWVLPSNVTAHCSVPMLSVPFVVVTVPGKLA